MIHDLTPPEHEHSEAVLVAADWLANERDPPHPVIGNMRQRFDLTAMEACEAAALAGRLRSDRRALG